MNTMTDSTQSRRHRPPEDDAVRGLRRDARRQRRAATSSASSARPTWMRSTSSRWPASASSRSRTSRAPGTWPTAMRASRAGTACASRRTAPASPTSSPSIAAAYWAHSPVVVITPETGSDDDGPRRLPGDRAAADLLEDHQVPGARQQPDAHGRAHRRAASTARMLELGPTQLNIPRDFFYGDIECEIPQPMRDRARRRRRAEPRRGGRTARQREVPGDPRRRRRGHGRRRRRGDRARRAAAGAGVQQLPAQRLRSRRAIRCGAARSATRARRRR